MVPEQVLEGLRWCGKALARHRLTRIADGVAPSAARLQTAEAALAEAAASIVAVAQRAQRGEYGSVAAFHTAFRAAAGAALLAGAGSRAHSNVVNRCAWPLLCDAVLSCGEDPGRGGRG